MRRWYVKGLGSRFEHLSADLLYTFRFEKWQTEKVKRMSSGQPAVVDYRDITFVSLTVDSA